MFEYISYALLAVGIFTAYMAFVSLFKKDKNLARSQKMGVVFPGDNEGQPASLRFIESVLAGIGIDVRQQRETSIQLAKAGMGGPYALSYFVFFKRVVQPILLVIGLCILGKLFLLSSTPASTHMAVLLTGFLFTLVGGFGGSLLLSNSAARRRTSLTKTFPEALDLLLICVESGLGIDAAFTKVSKELKGPEHKAMAAEFERTRFEMSMLNDRAQALLNFGERADLPAFRSLVSSLVQAERFGTSLVETLRLIAEEQRNERMMNAEKKAARIPAMITVPLIFCILPALIIVILGPPILNMMANGGLPH